MGHWDLGWHRGIIVSRGDCGKSRQIFRSSIFTIMSKMDKNKNNFNKK